MNIPFIQTPRGKNAITVKPATKLDKARDEYDITVESLKIDIRQSRQDIKGYKLMMNQAKTAYKIAKLMEK